jgi:uncharacterized protein involved in exopolysaccharide biosynthesis
VEDPRRPEGIVSAPDLSLLPLGSPDFWRAALGVVRSALRRSRVSIVVVTLLFTAAGVLAARITPQSFSTDARLLVRKADLMPALAHPRRSVPSGSDNLTQSAGDFVRDRQALRAIVEQYDLTTRWERDRPPLLKLKDGLLVRLRGPVPEADRVDALVDVLAKRIQVTVNGEVITVWARWSHAATAVDIVQGATEAYLQARRRVDIDAIADTYTLLERSVEAARLDVEHRVETTRLVTRRRPSGIAPASLAAEPTRMPADPLIDRRAQLLAAERTADTLAAAHEATIRTLETQLAERLARATERHPDVLALRRQLEQARVVPESVSQARVEADALRVLVDRATLTGRPSVSSSPRVVTAALAPMVTEDEGALYARSLLESSIASYQDLLDRLSNTRIELETARAAFDYRYALISGARTPTRPDSPNGLFLIVGALIAGLVAGTGRAVLREVRQ